GGLGTGVQTCAFRIERGDSASLTELVEWLVKRKAWSVVNEVADRFAASFEADAQLLYTLCEARLAEGQRDLAEQMAAKALKLNEIGRTSWRERREGRG